MKTPVLVFAAHPDDWQIFAGPAIYEHLRDPRTRVSIINLTAEDAGDDEHHWKSRRGGAYGAGAVRTAWRRGWEREMEVFKNRQYFAIFIPSPTITRRPLTCSGVGNKRKTMCAHNFESSSIRTALLWKFLSNAFFRGPLS
jgi:hypothetical protein